MVAVTNIITLTALSSKEISIKIALRNKWASPVKKIGVGSLKSLFKLYQETLAIVCRKGTAWQKVLDLVRIDFYQVDPGSAVLPPFYSPVKSLKSAVIKNILSAFHTF